MGRPPSKGAPAFRFTQTEVAEMEAILQQHNNTMPASEVLVALAEKFSESTERKGKGIAVQMKQVWNWFHNRRYAIRAKSSKVLGKLNVSPMSRDDSNPMRNVPQGPQPIAAPIHAPSVLEPEDCPQSSQPAPIEVIRPAPPAAPKPGVQQSETQLAASLEQAPAESAEEPPQSIPDPSPQQAAAEEDQGEGEEEAEEDDEEGETLMTYMRRKHRRSEGEVSSGDVPATKHQKTFELEDTRDAAADQIEEGPAAGVDEATGEILDPQSTPSPLMIGRSPLIKSQRSHPQIEVIRSWILNFRNQPTDPSSLAQILKAIDDLQSEGILTGFKASRLKRGVNENYQAYLRLHQVVDQIKTAEADILAPAQQAELNKSYRVKVEFQRALDLKIEALEKELNSTKAAQAVLASEIKTMESDLNKLKAKVENVGDFQQALDESLAEERALLEALYFDFNNLRFTFHSAFGFYV